MQSLRPKILVVGDDPADLALLRRQLGADFDVTAASNPKEAIRMVVSGQRFEVVVSDLRMSGMDGVALLYLIRQSAPATVRMLLTCCADLDATTAAINQGNVFRFLLKPCPPEVLIKEINACVEEYRRTAAL